MRTKLLLTILFATFGLSINAQTTFQKIFGSIGQDGGYSVIQTADSNYIFTGYWTTPTNQSYLFLIKVNSIGDTIWTRIRKTFSCGNTGGYSIIQTSDLGYAVVGYKLVCYPSQNTQFYMLKTNEIGDSLWGFTYGQNYVDYAYSVKQTSEGGFIIAGYTDTITGSVGHLYLIKTDVIGASIWSKTYGSSKYGEAHSVIQTSDDGYVVVGFLQQSNGLDDVYLVKTDNNGDTLWTKYYGGANEDVGYCIQKTHDNGFIIAGATMTYGVGGYDAYLIKTNSNGIMQWQKTFGGLDDDWGNYVYPTSDGGYIIAGSTQSFSNGNYDIYLVKTDSLGNQQWYKSFGGINADYAYSVQQTFDGGYILVGMRGDNIYLIKTDGNGNATSINEMDISVLSSNVSIFPNPFSSATTIQSNTNLENATLTVYNSFGQQVKESKNISGQSITFLRDNLPNGIYYIRLTEDNKIIAANKIIITD